ncbi:MAG: glycosyltransferase family 4 protein [Bacteroidetes bacterium]|nr:glycosyltransferase family 4 protein [Bacteroidota bacterium]
MRGGLSTYNQILASEFQKNGCNVTILTFKLQYPAFLFPGKTQLSTDLPPENLKIDIKINSINPLNWFFTGLKYRKLKPELVVVRYWLPFMGPCLGTISRIIKSNGKSKIVAITDNLVPHEKRFGDKMFTKYFLNSCHGFVAMSKSVLSDLKKLIKNKPTLYNPHPIYNSFQNQVSKTEACKILNLDNTYNYLLFFGFIRAYKGLDLLLKSFAKTDRKKFNLKLIIAGEFYENEKPYFELLETLELKKDVIFFKDFIPDSKVHLYFSAADITVQPYKEATQSGVTQVSYFYNKPMIVTNIGGLPELVPNGKAGFVVEKNPEEIAKAIEKFYTENLSETMTLFVQQEKEKYSWDNMIFTLWQAAEK